MNVTRVSAKSLFDMIVPRSPHPVSNHSSESSFDCFRKLASAVEMQNVAEQRNDKWNWYTLALIAVC